MPTISRFMGIVVTMYFDDHPPPHFHVRAAERTAKIRIRGLVPLYSDLRPRELQLVLRWADVHALELRLNWRRAAEGARLHPIEP